MDRGIAVCWLRSFWQHILLKRILNGCVQLENSQWNKLLSTCSESLGLHQEVSLFQHKSAHSPVSTGLWNPAVILPNDAKGWDVDRRRLVLLHELAHVQRRDVLTQTLAGIACGLYWFNPLCWYGLFQMRKFRELACDDLVLSCDQQPSGYADVLLGIARSYRHQSYSTAVGMAHSTNVESRIMAILDKTRRRVSLSRTAARLLLVSAAALVCLVGTAQLRSQAEPPSTRPSLEVLLKKFAEHEQAYLPYHFKSIHTLRMADGITQEQRDRYPWADGRKHQRRMEYGQFDATTWLRKEIMLYDGRANQREFNQYSNGKRLLKVQLNDFKHPTVYEVVNPKEIQRLGYVEPILGVFPLSAFSTGELLSSAIKNGDIEVSLDWDNDDAKLSFEYGDPAGIRTRFDLWLSADHDWHPIKMERRYQSGETPVYSDWEVTKFEKEVEQPKRWRVKAGILSFSDIGDMAEITPQTDDVVYFVDFEVLAAKYGQEVSREIFEYEIPENATLKAAEAEPSPNAVEQEKSVGEEAEEKTKQDTKEPIRITIVIAQHLMLLEGREVISWEQLDKEFAALSADARVHPEFYFTNGAHSSGRYQQSKDKMWELHRKHNWHGRSEGSLWPSAGARYDRFKTAGDLVPEESRRLDIVVVDQGGKSVADAEVLLMPPVDESVSFKEHHLTLVDGRVNNRIAYEMTLSDDQGRVRLYPPAEGNYYLVALHPAGGFAITQRKYVEKEPKITLLRWAALASKLELKPGEKQHASLSTKVPESPGLPVLVFQQDLESDKEEDEAELFGFTHVPPIYNTTVRRSFPHPKDGSAISLPGATVSLLPGEKRQLGLGPLSDAQREQLEDMQRRSEERRKKFERQLEEQATSGAEQPSHEMQIRILDDAGDPLEGAKLYSNHVRPHGAVGDRIVNTNLVANEAGEITLPMDRNRDTVKLWAWASGKVPEFVWLNRSPEKIDALLPYEYEFRLAEGTSIGGIVVDDSGAPIANVHVRVKVRTAPYNGNDSVNAEPRVSDWLTDSFNQPKVETDSNGRWRIDNAPGSIDGQDYEFRIKLDHPDYTGDSRWGGLQSAQGVTTEQLRAGNAKIVLSRGAHVEGKVVDPEGKPVTNGWFVWHDEPYFTQGKWEARLDEQGSFKTPQLDPGEHPIIIIAPGFAAQRRVVNVEPGMAPLRFDLKTGNRTEIRFVDTAGNPIPKASVYLGGMSGIGAWNGTNALHSQGSPGAEYGIPRRADEQGSYVWNWAPDGAVRYHVGAKGFAGKTVSLVTQSEPHVVRLSPARVAVGKLTDSETGKPISKFLAMPVIVFGPNHYSTGFTDRKAGVDGHYELPLTGSGNPEDHYRVRFEAGGYRSIVSEESFGPLDGRVELNVQLEPVSAREGRVVDTQGKPVFSAKVIEGTSTWVPGIRNGEPNSYGERIVLTDKDGRFELNATNEPVRVRILHDSGIAEKLVAPEDNNIGDLELQPWASVSGSLIQDGQPIADHWINFSPLVRRGLGEARFQDSYSARTDAAGRFEMKRLPPGTGSLRAYLGPWEDSPLTSGESLTLELKPGENRSVVLGGEGAVLTGQVVATGRDEAPLDRNWSLNYLISRDRGAKLPDDFPALSFDPFGAMQPAWSLDSHFDDWLRTRENHFVKLTHDGKLRATGVAPGEYDLVIRLYEQPAGCLVETVGEKIVPVRVEGAGEINLGQIEVPCRAGPRAGSDMRVYEFVDITGRKQTVNDLAGQYVLMHVWATWCGPCLESMPDIQQMAESLADRSVTFVGLNVDRASDQASELAQRKGWNWSQNYLGDDSDIARQLAISSVPTYYLIGPDGLLATSANEWSEIKKKLVSLVEATHNN